MQRCFRARFFGWKKDDKSAKISRDLWGAPSRLYASLYVTPNKLQYGDSLASILNY